MEAGDTEKSSQPSPNNGITVRKRSKLKWFAAAVVLMIITAIAGYAITIALNNYPMWSDQEFSTRLDEAIENGTNWINSHEEEVVSSTNVALIKMLRQCDNLSRKDNFNSIYDKFMAIPLRPACWKTLIDPNLSVYKWELNKAIKEEPYIDNKWILYAIAPDKADVTPEQIGLFSNKKRKIIPTVHQLWALTHLRKTDQQADVDGLIELLCNRIVFVLTFNPEPIDHTIQKIGFILYAGYPEKVRRRWVEKTINNQLTDGGWNDRWFRFESRERRIQSLLTLGRPPSNPHGTIEALWVLYQVKYQYPEYFGLK
ncbi:MAG: hypothetical protein JW806_01970 [Sedimentisphaerales bacterium]|nr:hypothetical protein [Sedimentisphaerales bacterium]